MKKNCCHFAAFMLAVVLIMAALPVFVTADAGETKSPFSNVTCVFDRASAKIKLEYRMKSEDVKKYADSEIQLYALSATQSVEDIPSLEPRVTGLSPSNRAGAEVRYEGLADRLSSYVFAMKTNDGLICSEPIRPQVTSARPDLPFKGIETSSTALTVGTASGTVIIDLNIGSLISNGHGYLYPTGGYTYTFSSTYLNDIDDLIMLYRGAGRRILLRIITDDLPQELFADAYEIQRTVYACVSFLYSHYDTEKFGGVNGFILGTGAQTKAEFAEDYADMLYAVAAGLNDLGASCPIIVPVGDDFVTITEFLDKLVDRVGRAHMFSLMLESRHEPYGIDDYHVFKFDGIGSGNASFEPSDASSSYISAENLTRLTRLIDNNYRNSIYQDIIYHWTPGKNVTGDAAMAAYVYNYYALSQIGQTVSFIVSPSDQMDKKLVEAVKYINTDLSDSFIDNERILKLFGFDSWGSHFDRYDVTKLQEITVKNKSIHSGVLPRFIGTVDYFDFSSSTDLSDWYAGQNCDGIYSDTAVFGKSFNANLSFPEGRMIGSAFVSYTYRYSESFRYTDYIAVELSIESEDGDGEYDVIVSMGGDGFLYEYTAQGVPAGGLRTIYLDVREFNESMVTDFLRITVEPREGNSESAKLCLYSVTANSLTYNSDRLRDYILSERERLKSDGDETLNDIGRNAVVFIVATLIATGLVMIMISRHRRKKRTDGENNE